MQATMMLSAVPLNAMSGVCIGNIRISSDLENRAMMAEKFDSDTLSLHVLSIP